jgi:hypothetical protein
MAPPIQWYIVDTVRVPASACNTREEGRGGSADLAVYIEHVEAVINGYCLISDEPRRKSPDPNVKRRNKDSEEKE